MKALDELRARFDTLEPRERRFLVAGAVAVVAAVLYFAVVAPLAAYRAQLEQRVESQRELVAWMRGAVEVLRERGPAREPAVDTSGSLLALVDSSARSAGLAQPLRRIQQEGDDAVRVRLEGAGFDQVIVWLDNLRQRYGVIASDMSVDRAEGAGLVNASITLTRAAP